MNILVVDDDEAICAQLNKFLSHHGFHVSVAFDALQALSIVEEAPVDLVITDLMMPHMNGVTFTQKLREDPRFKDLMVIMITAAPQSELLEQALRKGVALTLPKPLDLNQLLNLVRFAQ